MTKKTQDDIETDPKTAATPGAQTKQTKLRLVKFGSPHCSPCVAMDKAKTLEKLQAKFPDLEVEKIDLMLDPDFKDGLSDDQVKAMTANGDIADEYDVEAMPTFVFETDDGTEVHRETGGQSLSGLETAYKDALKKLSRKGAKP